MLTLHEATALVRRWRASPGGIYLGRGNFGQALLIEGAVLKLPVDRDIHGRPWPPAEILAAFRQEAAAASTLRAAGFDVVPATVLVEDAQGPVLVREYGEPAGGLSVAEWDRLAQRLSAVQAAGWLIRDRLLLLRRPGGSLFVGDVGLWRLSPRPIDEHQDDLPDLLDEVRPRELPRRFSSWHELSRRAHTGQARWASAREDAARLGRPWPEARRMALALFNLRSLYDGVMERTRRRLPVPGEALAMLALARDTAHRTGLPWPPARPPPLPGPYLGTREPPR
jgi:hypothetical protein